MPELLTNGGASLTAVTTAAIMKAEAGLDPTGREQISITDGAIQATLGDGKGAKLAGSAPKLSPQHNLDGSWNWRCGAFGVDTPRLQRRLGRGRQQREYHVEDAKPSK